VVTALPQTSFNLQQQLLKVSSIARIENPMNNPMDDEALNGAPSAIKIRSSVSEAGARGRRIAMAEEGAFSVDRTAWAIRWRHPLARSIEARRGKVSRS
jgi:hypothetical protein